MTVYNINFKTGKLEAIDNVNLLPVGSLVSYGDQANERTRAVVTGSRIASHGQTCVFEDGHQSEVSRNVIDGPGGWQLVTTEGKPLILDADQIKAFIEEAMQTKDRLQEELTRIQRVQKKRDEQERERIIIEFSWLTRLDGTRSPWSIGAQNLRRELSRLYPKIKFSVCSKSYSGGNSIDASWTDGPTTEQVNHILSKYQKCDFDGSQDLETYRPNIWAEIFGGAKYVFGQRKESVELTIGAAELGYSLTPDQFDEWGSIKECVEYDRETIQTIYRQARAKEVK